MKRAVLALILALAFTCLCAAAAAEPGKLYLVFIGGDGDVAGTPNDVFKAALAAHEDLQDKAETFLVRSVKSDYTNATAIRQGKLAEECLSPDGINVVAAYSHGGQSLYFMNLDNVTDVFLLDGCVSIGGKCTGKDYESKGRVWSQWIVDTARKGINVHHYAPIGKHNEATASKNAMSKLEKMAEEDETLVALGDGQYRVLDEAGNAVALIDTGLWEGEHKNICRVTVDRIAEWIYQILDR